MAILSCWFDYIWNELQSRTYPRFWEKELEKSLGPGMVVEAFNLRRQRQADLWVQGQPGIKFQVKKSLGPSVVVQTFKPT